MKQLSQALLASAIFLFASCNSETSDTAMVKSETFDLAAAQATIEAHNKNFAELYRNGDTIAIANHFTDDAVIYPPEMEEIKKDQAPAVFGAFKRMGVAELSLTTTSVKGDANQLIELGKWAIMAADKSKIDHGKYLVIWVNENGTWKTAYDVWNNSTAIARAQ
jgi:ketosteroid isomerase-like protein